MLYRLCTYGMKYGIRYGNDVASFESFCSENSWEVNIDLLTKGRQEETRGTF